MFKQRFVELEFEIQPFPRPALPHMAHSIRARVPPAPSDPQWGRGVISEGSGMHEDVQV